MWLNEIKLAQYCAKFDSEGYDDLNFILQMNENQIEDMLNDVEMVKKGHIAKFEVELKKLKENEPHGLDDGARKKPQPSAAKQQGMRFI